MSNKTSFFSFSESNRHTVAKIKGRAVNPFYSNLNFKVQDLLKRWNTEAEPVIRQAITKSLQGASRTIVFIGDDTHKSFWVGEEIKMTIAAGKPVYAIRIKDTTGKAHPEMTKNGVFLYQWSEVRLQELATI
jgi:hypothetical protein